MAPSALLTDLDGTLWRANDWYARVSSEAVISSGLDAGRPVARLLREAGVTRARFATFARAHIDDLELAPFAHETLALARASGTKLGAVTNLPGWLVHPMLEASELVQFFDVVVDWATCPRRKPHPDPLFYALAVLGKEPNAGAWYVGDSPDDAQAAAAAGISFAWASYGYFDEAPPNVDRVITAFEEVGSL